jgi:bifunctional NMN adenylyltransferase/nudix hydrolase
MRYDYAAFIGRFQPFHLGHLSVLKQAFESASHVIVVLGSANCAQNPKNPFSVAQREYLIRSALTEEERQRLTVVSVRDYLYDDGKWVMEVQNKVHEIAGYDKNVALIGYKKDRSSYYLDLFPLWQFIHASANKYTIDATDVRQRWFTRAPFEHLVPESVYLYLSAQEGLVQYATLKAEYEYLKAYKESWNGPYAPVFVTVDCVVLVKNQILLIERKDLPGKGLYALPGGFINPNEKLVDSAVRELREETAIRFPEELLRSHISESKVFDHPGRSLRGRTITHAFCFRLGTNVIPQVSGGDDAAKAKWFSLQDFYRMETSMYEDHAQIITYFTEK